MVAQYGAGSAYPIKTSNTMGKHSTLFLKAFEMHFGEFTIEKVSATFL